MTTWPVLQFQRKLFMYKVFLNDAITELKRQFILPVVMAVFVGCNETVQFFILPQIGARKC